MIGSVVELKIRGQNLGYIIFKAIGREELIGEDGEFSGVESIELPVDEGHDDVDEEDEAQGEVENGGEGCDERAAVVGRDASPIEGEGADA